MLSFSLDRLRVPCHDTQDNSVTDLALRKGRRLIHRGYVWGGGGGDGVDGIPETAMSLATSPLCPPCWVRRNSSAMPSILLKIGLPSLARADWLKASTSVCICTWVVGVRQHCVETLGRMNGILLLMGEWLLAVRGLRR